MHSKRGRAIIINNEFFINQAMRQGAKEDLKELRKLFESLDFEVEGYTDLTGEVDCFSLFALLHRHVLINFSSALYEFICLSEKKYV